MFLLDEFKCEIIKIGCFEIYVVAILTGTVLVKDRDGLHARPCAKILRLTHKYPKLTITFIHPDRDIEKGEPKTADGHSMYEMILLAAEFNTQLEVKIEGQEQQCQALLVKLQDLFEHKLCE